MSKRKLKIRDFLKVESVEIVEDNKKILDSYGLSPDGSSVVVKIAATHSGRVTKNNTFYLADKMRNSVSSWTQDFAKPILTHHDKKGTDPIGRVLSARYVDTSGNIQGNLRNAICRDSRGENEFQRFVDGTMSFMQQIDFIQNNLSHTRVLDNSDYQGLGYIELTALISDPEAAQKVRDGRYLTGSISATTDRAVCSVCKQDWIDEGKCDHSPGELYDGTKAFLVAGEFEYEEYSYVNDPADTLSQNLELVSDAVSDNVEGSESQKDNQLSDALEIDSHAARQLLIQAHDALHHKYDYEIALAMRRKQAESNGEEVMPLGRDMMPPKGDVDLHEQLHREAKRAKLLGDILHGAMDVFITDDSIRAEHAEMPEEMMDDSSKETKSTMAVNDETKTVDTSEETVDETAALEEGSQQEDSAKEGAAVEKTQAAEETQVEDTTDEAPAFTQFNDAASEDLDAKLAVLDEAEDELDDETAEVIYELMVREMDDAASELSEEDAQKLLDAKLSTEQRNKLPSSTFCGPGRSFPVPDCAHVTAARRLIGRAKVSNSTKSKILACVARKARAMDCTSASSDAVEETTANVEGVACEPCQAKDTKLNTLEQENAKLRDHLKALREENAMLYKDFADMEDQVIAAELTARKVKAQYVADYKQLSGESVEDPGKLVDELSELDDNQLNSLVDSVDTKSIVDKLNSGLSRTPSETVDDPSVGTIQDKEENGASEQLPETIRENYDYLMDKSGARKARNYLVRMVNEGHLDADWLERLS